MSEEDKISAEDTGLSELEIIKAQADVNLAGWQRAQADYANFKRETENHRQDVIEFANAAFMAEVLPIYNNFKLALDHIPEDQLQLDWVIGLAHIKKQFQEFLKKYKIQEIKTVGEKFDHRLHEAVTHEENDNFDSDVIFAEIQSGYTVDGKVLMPAKVKVTK